MPCHVDRAHSPLTSGTVLKLTDEVWGLSEGIQPCIMKNRDIYWRRYKKQETPYIGQWCFSPLQSRHLETSHSSPNRHQLPSCIFLNLIPWSEISSLSKVILVLGKGRSHRAPNLGCLGSGAELPVWFAVLKKIPQKTWSMSSALWWSCPSSVTHNYCLLNHPSSFHGGMFKLNAKLDADSLLYSLSHFECDGHPVNMVTQQCLLPILTSRAKSSLFIHTHSRPLSWAASLHRYRENCSHYINNDWSFSRQTSTYIRNKYNQNFIHNARH